MEYSSFYGGRRGASFVIKKSYPSIEAMISDFQTLSCQVNFEQYVLINTQNKNHPDNGKLFRRGLDVNSSRTILRNNISEQEGGYVAEEITAYGAQYIGSIVGPSGKAPLLAVKDYDDITTDVVGGLVNKGVLNGIRAAEIPSRIVTIAEDVYDSLSIIEQNNLANGIIPTSVVLSSDTFANYEILPGRYYLTIRILGRTEPIFDNTIVYNDDIQYVSACFRDENEDETVAYIGFKFPYHMVTAKTQSVSTYGNDSSQVVLTEEQQALMKSGVNYSYYNDTSDIIENPAPDNTYHAFYSDYTLSIPKGVHGQNVQNFRVATLTFSVNNNVYTFYNEGTEIWLYDENNVRITTLPADIRDYWNETSSEVVPKNQIQVMLYDIENFDKTNPGIIKTYYLGVYNQISSLSVDKFGTIIINYTSAPTKRFLFRIKWIEDIVLNQGVSIGKLVNDLPQYITFARDGESQVIIDQDKADSYATAQQGRVIIYYNTYSPYEAGSGLETYTKDYDVFDLDYINNISIAQNGQVSIQKTSSGTSVLPNNLEWINRVETVNSGAIGNQTQKLVFYKNTGSTAGQFNFDYVAAVLLDPTTGHFQVKYASGKVVDLVSFEGTAAIFKTIERVQINNSTGVGTIYYNNNETSIFYLKQLDSIESIESLPVSENGGIFDDLDPEVIIPTTDVNYQEKRAAISELLQRDTLNNYFRVNYKGVTPAQGSSVTTSSNYINGFNDIERITFTPDEPSHLLVLYSSIEKRIELIRNNLAYLSNGSYIYDGDVGWKDLGTLGSISIEDIGFGWDITDEFAVWQEQQASPEKQHYYYPHRTEDVITYLTEAYPTGIQTIEIGGETKNFIGHLVSITVGENSFVITDGDNFSYNTSEVVGSTVFVPYQWTQGAEITSTIYTEPAKTFYGFNYRSILYTYVSDTQLSSNQLTREGIANLDPQFSGNPLSGQGAGAIYGTLDTESSYQGHYEYHWYRYGGWYSVSNILSGLNSESDSSGSGSGSGDAHYFQSNAPTTAPAGSIWFVTSN